MGRRHLTSSLKEPRGYLTKTRAGDSLFFPCLTQKVKCCCLLCNGISAYHRHIRAQCPMETENAVGETSMKEAWTLHSCIICILSEIINLSNPPCGVWEIMSRCGFYQHRRHSPPLNRSSQNYTQLRNNSKILPHGRCTKQALLMFCGCTSACTEPEGRGLCLQALGGTPKSNLSLYRRWQCVTNTPPCS